MPSQVLDHELSGRTLVMHNTCAHLPLVKTFLASAWYGCCTDCMLQDMLAMLKQKEEAKAVEVSEATAETAETARRYEVEAALQQQSAAKVRFIGH